MFSTDCSVCRKCVLWLDEARLEIERDRVTHNSLNPPHSFAVREHLMFALANASFEHDVGQDVAGLPPDNPSGVPPCT